MRGQRLGRCTQDEEPRTARSRQPPGERPGTALLRSLQEGQPWSGLLPSRTMREKCLLFKSPSLWYFSTAATGNCSGPERRPVEQAHGRERLVEAQDPGVFIGRWSLRVPGRRTLTAQRAECGDPEQPPGEGWCRQGDRPVWTQGIF